MTEASWKHSVNYHRKIVSTYFIEPREPVQHEQRDQMHDGRGAKGIDRELFTDSYTVTWLKGFAPPAQFGSGPFVAVPALAWYKGEHFSLIVKQRERHLLFCLRRSSR